MPEWSSVFSYFVQFESGFGNNVFMIWATVSSQYCFCWLYGVSPTLPAKNIINLISLLTIWWCPWVESSFVLLEEDVCYDQCTLLTNSICLCPASLEEVAINPTIVQPELPQDWEADSWRTHTEPCAHQDPGAMTPYETDPDLAMSVPEIPAEAWVGSDLLLGWGHWV